MVVSRTNPSSCLAMVNAWALVRRGWAVCGVGSARRPGRSRPHRPTSRHDRTAAARYGALTENNAHSPRRVRGFFLHSLSADPNIIGEATRRC